MDDDKEGLLGTRNTFALRLPRRSDGRITPPVADAELVSTLDELRDLRAYKERTEAGLVGLSLKVSERDFANNGLVVYQVQSLVHRVRDMVREDMEKRGLWRDPPQAEVQP